MGGILTGRGKMWIDQLEIRVDGKIAVPSVVHSFAAREDNEFDSGSGIEAIPVNERIIVDLYELGLVWEYVKYYHPGISKGNYNIDYELFRILPVVLDAKDKQSRDNMLVKWIEHLGSFDPDGGETQRVGIVPDIEVKPTIQGVKEGRDELLEKVVE